MCARDSDHTRGLGRSTFSLVAALLLCAIAVTLFTYNVHRYTFLGDDAFISFRYARNLYQGYGLVWNPGERVEGYTNFLWVMLMALGMVLGLSPEVLSGVLGIAGGVVVLLFLVRLSARYLGWRSPLIWLAPIVLATSRTFTAWCTGGLATMFFTMLVFLALTRFARERERPEISPAVSSLLFALAALTRPEGNIFAAVAGLFFVIQVLSRKRTARSFLLWVLPFAVIVGTHLVWRHAYYGYWLPNSFYAKVSGFWGEQAYRYLSMFQRDYKVFFFAPVALLPVIVKRSFIHALFTASIVAYLAYVVYVGGDRFEFRFLVPLLPLFYWLVVEGIALIASVRRRRPESRRVATVVAVGLALMLWVTTYLGSTRPQARKTRYDIASIEEIRAYAERRAREGKFLRELIDRGLLPDDIVLCVTGAGAVPYYSGLPTVDLYGMNDTRIAHQEIAERGVIAHEKRGTSDYMRERGVELFDRLNKLVNDVPVQNQRCPDNRGCWKSIRIGRYYLDFVTFLPDTEYEKRFGNLLRASNTSLDFTP
jgi:arabinofuranosyltransferase